MSHHQWMLFLAATGGAAIAASIQAWYVSRLSDRVFERETDIQSVAEWTKLTRQDVAGMLVTLGIANMLLGAILAVLIFR